MNREALVAARGAAWDRLEALLAESAGARGAGALGPAGVEELARLYRALAGDLMRVRRDRLGADLEAHLDGLAARAHDALHARSASGPGLSPLGLLREFPAAVRRNGRLFLAASLLFFGTGLLAGLAAYLDEAWALAVLSPGELRAIEAMYATGQEGRAAGASAGMTGFYVFNNVGIAFRCFATGILFGLGTVFFLVFNGLSIGVVFGHLLRVGHGDHLLSFTASHGPWELTAIAIAGAAGLQMGHALVVTRGRTRFGSLRATAPELLRQVLGAGAFLALAALIEAWWSPSALPPAAKHAAGLAGWVAVALVLWRGGRARATR
jgi:uncharacterized membrane protein SpoIIM required for sporulation